MFGAQEVNSSQKISGHSLPGVLPAVVGWKGRTISQKVAKKTVRYVHKFGKHRDPDKLNKYAERLYRWKANDQECLQVVLNVIQQVDEHAQVALFHSCERMRSRLVPCMPARTLTSALIKVDWKEQAMLLVNLLQQESMRSSHHRDIVQLSFASKLTNTPPNEIQDILKKEGELWDSLRKFWNLLPWKIQLVLMLSLPEDSFNESLKILAVTFNQIFTETSPILLQLFLDKFNDSFSIGRLQTLFDHLALNNKIALLGTLSKIQYEKLTASYVQTFHRMLNKARKETLLQLLKGVQSKEHRERVSYIATQSGLVSLRQLIVDDKEKRRHLVEQIQKCRSDEDIQILVAKEEKDIWWPESLFYKVNKTIGSPLATKGNKWNLVRFCHHYLKVHHEQIASIREHLESIIHAAENDVPADVMDELKETIQLATQAQFVREIWQFLEEKEFKEESVQQILIGYHGFVSTEAFCAHLLEIYRTQESKKAAVINICIRWMAFTDIREQPWLIEQFQNTILNESDTMNNALNEAKTALKNCLELISSPVEKKHAPKEPLPFEEIRQKVAAGEKCWDEISTLATDLKEHSSELMLRFSLLECYYYSSQHSDLCPNIRAITQDLNQLSDFVTSEILAQESPQTRAYMCDFFLNLAHKLLRIGDLHSFMGILGGVSRIPILRLKDTMNLLEESSVSLWEEFDSMQLANFKKMREQIQAFTNADHPSVPNLGVFLQDLEFIKSGNPNICNKQLNFAKLDLLSKVLQQIWSLQQRLRVGQDKVPLIAVEKSFSQWLKTQSQLIDKDEEWIKISFLREPAPLPPEIHTSEEDD